jgi:major membrane immunogen (membrane-anchored lipoprotein)
MKKILSIGLLSLSILFASCSSDDNSDSNSIKSISATINGKEWKPSKINSVTLIKFPGSNNQRFDINIQDDSQMLMLACESSLTTNDAMPLKEYNFYEDNEETDGNELTLSDALFINTYLIDGNTYTEHIPSYGKIKITEMDTQKKTVSGTFSFKALKGNALQTKVLTPDVFEVTNGVFKNLPYTVFTTP